jgi:hypothetical protein
MAHVELPTIIQGGMGVGLSNWCWPVKSLWPVNLVWSLALR